MPFMPIAYPVKQPQPPWSKFVQPVGSLPFMICSSTYKQGVSCHACFNFSRFRFGPPTLPSGNSHHLLSAWALDLRNIELYMRSFKIYGIWEQASKQTYAHARCSPASVGLTQARPNKMSGWIFAVRQISDSHGWHLNWTLQVILRSINSHAKASSNVVVYK